MNLKVILWLRGFCIIPVDKISTDKARRAVPLQQHIVSWVINNDNGSNTPVPSSSSNVLMFNSNIVHARRSELRRINVRRMADLDGGSKMELRMTISPSETIKLLHRLHSASTVRTAR